LADFKAAHSVDKPKPEVIEETAKEKTDDLTTPDKKKPVSVAFRHNIEIHLPATTNIAVYNAIFKSLREHLVD
jgi:hypothetical protein